MYFLSNEPSFANLLHSSLLIEKILVSPIDLSKASFALAMYFLLKNTVGVIFFLYCPRDI